MFGKSYFNTNKFDETKSSEQEEEKNSIIKRERERKEKEKKKGGWVTDIPKGFPKMFIDVTKKKKKKLNWKRKEY